MLKDQQRTHNSQPPLSGGGTCSRTLVNPHICVYIGLAPPRTDSIKDSIQYMTCHLESVSTPSQLNKGRTTVASWRKKEIQIGINFICIFRIIYLNYLVYYFLYISHDNIFLSFLSYTHPCEMPQKTYRYNYITLSRGLFAVRIEIISKKVSGCTNGSVGYMIGIFTSKQAFRPWRQLQKQVHLLSRSHLMYSKKDSNLSNRLVSE